MSQHVDTLRRTISGLQDVKTLGELQKTITKETKDLGIRYFTYHILKTSGASSHLPYYITTYPQSWVKHYITENYVKVDPIVAAGPRNSMPFLWNDIAQPGQPEGRQAKLFSEANDMHIRNGLSVPIHSNKGNFAIMSFVPDGTPQEAGQIIETIRDKLHLMAFYCHEYGSRILCNKNGVDDAQNNTLTPRERECLQWVAAGKTAWEVSAILAVSQACVVFHLENAKRKLSASNRTHAVAKAMALGLITAD